MRTTAAVMLATTAAVAGAAITGGVAWSTIPDSNGVVHGCIAEQDSQDTNSPGTLRIIDAPDEKCPGGDKAVSFAAPSQPPVFSAVDASSRKTLHARRQRTVLTTKLTLGQGYDAWTQPTVNVTGGKRRATVTLQLIVDGKPDEAPLVQTVAAHQHEVVAGVLNCDGFTGGVHTISVALTSSRSGVVVGARTEVVQAVVG